MRRLLFGPAVAFVIATLAVAAHPTETDLDRPLRAKSLRCTLGPGALADWRSGTPEAPLVSQAMFASQPSDRVTQFDSIDLKAGTARNIGNNAAGILHVVGTDEGLTFIDLRPRGLVVVTVYGSAIGGQYVVVYSSHLELVGMPRPSQYYGTCQIWE